MVTRDEILAQYPQLEPGLSVYTHDGEKLGKILLLEPDYFLIEKGFFFPKDYHVPYGDILDIRQGELVLSRHRGELEPWRDEHFSGWDAYGFHPRDEVELEMVEKELEARRRLA